MKSGFFPDMQASGLRVRETRGLIGSNGCSAPKKDYCVDEADACTTDCALILIATPLEIRRRCK